MCAHACAYVEYAYICMCMCFAYIHMHVCVCVYCCIYIQICIYLYGGTSLSYKNHIKYHKIWYFKFRHVNLTYLHYYMWVSYTQTSNEILFLWMMLINQGKRLGWWHIFLLLALGSQHSGGGSVWISVSLRADASA